MARKQVKKASKKKRLKELTEDVSEDLDLSQDSEDELDSIEELGVEGAETSDEIDDDVLSFNEREAAFDLFVDFGSRVMEKGGIPRYTILRNNQHLATVDHPYSWDEVQKEYGGGHYKVICRNAANGQFIKSQTRMVADIPGHRPLKSRNAAVEEDFEDQPSQPAQPSFMETMTFLKQMNSDSKREAEAQNSNSTNAFATMLTALMQAQQSQAQQTQNLMMEQSKFQAQMIQQQNTMMMQFMEKMNDKLEKGSDKSKEMDPFKMIEMMQRERDNGFKLAKEIRDMANELAEEKAELLSSGDDGEEKGWVSTLAKSLPALLAGMAQAPQQAVPQGNYPQVVQPRPQTEVDIHGRRKLVERPRQEQRRPTPTPTPVVATTEAVGNTFAGSIAPVKKSETQNLKTVRSAPLSQPRLVNGVPLKDAVQQVALPILTQRMTENADPRASGRELLQVLGQVSITREELLAAFTWNEIMGIVKQYSLDSYVPWLKEFYGEIQGPRTASASNGVGTQPTRKAVGEPTKNQPNPVA